MGLLRASNFVQASENTKGEKIACLEEIGYINGWIGKEEVLKMMVSCFTSMGFPIAVTRAASSSSISSGRVMIPRFSTSFEK